MLPRMAHSEHDPISLFLCGDVMTGRGVDQILPQPAKPVLYEAHVRDARDYVQLAEMVHGPIARPVVFPHIWGDALDVLQSVDVRIVNLETSITSSDDAWPGKEIHYRMSPDNVGCLTAARIDCCCLANNHVLDFGYTGLSETLQTLDRAGIARPGAGKDAVEAAKPAVLDVPGKGRVLVASLGSTTSGIPRQWAATTERAGVNLLDDLSEDTAARLASRIANVKRPGDVAIASIHWGGNWGYEVPDEQIRFAHRLIEDGIDIVHGHSSHHVKAIEVYRRRLILYGCGDLIDDYEGITGHEEFRNDLRLMYLIWMDAAHGWLTEARLVPMQMQGFRLNRASESDVAWLRDLANALGAPFGTRVVADGNAELQLRWH